tara:strand:- start:542 stop:778 length:237 start_codon:yes stop_codon:yes gene_type:complete
MDTLISNEKLKLRQQVLLILLSKYGNSTYSNNAIYECADDWCSKQVTANGVLSHFEAYRGSYETKGNNQVGQGSTQTS